MLGTLIPEHRKTVKDFVAAHGKDVVGQVTIEQVRQHLLRSSYIALRSRSV